MIKSLKSVPLREFFRCNIWKSTIFKVKALKKNKSVNINLILTNYFFKKNLKIYQKWLKKTREKLLTLKI